MAKGLFGGGTGTEQDPFLVEDAADLFKIAEHFSGPVYAGENYSYLQAQDIDLAGEDFVPIGDTNYGPPFMGNYDGGNYIIKNLTIRNDTSSNVGLFGIIDGSIIKNIRLVGADIICNGSSQYVGLLAGVCGGATVENCEIEGKIHGEGDGATLSGFAGSMNDSTIKGCYTNAKIEGINAIRGFTSTLGTTSVVDTIVTGTLKTLSIGSGHLSLFAGSMSDVALDRVIVLTTVEDITAPSYFDTWGGSLGGTDFINSFIGAERAIKPWDEKTEYPYGRFVLGTDGKFYKNFRPQEINPLEYETERPMNVQPIAGADWAEYWELIEGNHMINDEQLLNPSTFVGWDFENTWVMGANGPELKQFYSPSEEIPDDNDDTPSDLVIVTDVNFSRTKLIRDAFGSPIPQVWDHENKRYVPVTLQMVELMIKR